MNNSKISSQEKEEIIKDYNSGISINDLIKKYHHKFKVIVRILDEYGIKHSYTDSKLMKQPKIKLTQKQKNTIINLYANELKGLQYCVKAIGYNDVHIAKRVLKEAGIKLRSASEATIISNEQRRFAINDNYFKTESHNMAYLLGLYAADGTVSKKNNTIKITLSSVDKELLDMVAQELNYEKKPKTFTTSQGFECTSLEFTSREIKQDLAKYNIVPAKTFTFTFPTNLNKQYWIDFIRGYFDGDGSVSTSGTKAIKWQISAAGSDVLKHIVDFLFEEYSIPKVTVRYDKNHCKHGIYTICYSINATKEIYKILYTPDSLYMPRKKNKFTQIINN